jgi:hypothetical protein
MIETLIVELLKRIGMEEVENDMTETTEAKLGMKKAEMEVKNMTATKSQSTNIIIIIIIIQNMTGTKDVHGAIIRNQTGLEKDLGRKVGLNINTKRRDVDHHPKAHQNHPAILMTI